MASTTMRPAARASRSALASSRPAVMAPPRSRPVERLPATACPAATWIRLCSSSRAVREKPSCCRCRTLSRVKTAP
ncbi:hypothetical protein ACFQU7_17185 [Pseudoroseomonas wenyumeiae]